MKKKLVGACVFAQSGGPTAVINASAAGVFIEALKNECITHVYGASHGVMGIINDELYDINLEDEKEIMKLIHTPSSALGSTRHKLGNLATETKEYERILEVFKKHDIRYVFINGGNDSMDTCNKISKYMLSEGYECRVIGVPKTIDNDLTITDHCPGYGSAAKYVATTMMELGLDTRVYDVPMITIVEIMGRNAGWLTAAASLAGEYGPDLIYLPEIPFSNAKFLNDVSEVMERKGSCLIAISEGLRTKEGQYITEMNRGKDTFGHVQLGGAGQFLEELCRREFSCKCRSIEFNLMQRCASHIVSKTDVEEAYEAGRQAVLAATSGITDKMIVLERSTDENGQYLCIYGTAELSYTANGEKRVPKDWIINNGTGVSDKFKEYAMPLIQGELENHFENGLPSFAKLKKELVK